MKTYMNNMTIEEKVKLAKLFLSEGWSTHVSLSIAGITSKEKPEASYRT